MGPVRGDSQKALLFCVWPQEVSHWSSNDNTQKNRTTVTSCPVSFLLSHFHLLLLPSWAIFGSINMLKYIHDCSVVFTYIPLRKNGMYYSHLQPQMPKKPNKCESLSTPLPPTLTSFTAPLPPLYLLCPHPHHQQPSQLSIWLSCSASGWLKCLLCN